MSSTCSFSHSILAARTSALRASYSLLSGPSESAVLMSLPWIAASSVVMRASLSLSSPRPVAEPAVIVPMQQDEMSVFLVETSPLAAIRLCHQARRCPLRDEPDVGLLD